MKKILAVVLTALLLAGFCACEEGSSVTLEKKNPESTKADVGDVEMSQVYNDGDNDYKEEDKNSHVTEAVSDANPKDFTYKVDSDINKTAGITGYFGSNKVLKIPEMIDGYKITRIGDLGENYNIEDVILPDSVVCVDNNSLNGTAFYQNRSNWTDGALYLEEFLVVYKGSAENFTVKSGTKHICDFAFWESEELKTVTLPSSVVSIGHGAFNDCANLEAVYGGTGVQRIEEYAFRDCDKLSELVVSDNLYSVGADAFEETLLYDYEQETFYLGRCLVYVNTDYEGVFTVNPGTVGIGDNAFEDCEDVTEIKLPSSVTLIGEGAFLDCTNLSKINIDDQITIIGEYAFMGCDSLTSFVLPKNLVWLGENLFVSCEEIKEITVPAGHPYFSQSSNGAVCSKDGKRLCLMPGGVEDRIFVVPSSVTEICAESLDCKDMDAIYIHKNVTNMNFSDFYACFSLDDIYYEGTASQWSALYKGQGIDESVTIHYSATQP